MPIQIITCHHGTSRENSQQILKCNYFRLSDHEDDWLGKGIYFFENSIWYAAWWAREIKKYHKFDVLEVELNIDNEKIFDLTNPDIVEILHRYGKYLLNRKKSSKSYAKNKPINDCMVIDYIYNHVKKFDMVKAIYDDLNSYKTYYKTRVRPHQIQLCLRNRDCVKKICKAVS